MPKSSSSSGSSSSSSTTGQIPNKVSRNDAKKVEELQKNLAASQAECKKLKTSSEAPAEAAIVVEDEPDWKQKYEELEEIYTKETHARNHAEAAKKRYTQKYYAPKSTEAALTQRVAHLERCREKLHV